MATTTYTAKLRLATPTTGELFGTWGNLANTGITALIDDAIAGRAVVTHSDAADYTLTSNNAVADEARMAVIRITGTLTAARNVVCPTQPKLYIMENATTGGFAVTLKTGAGSGVSVAAGDAAMLRCDGTNVIEWIPVTGTGSLVKATSPTLVTPALGTPASGVMTNVTGTAANLTSGITLALKSATTTVDVAAAAAPATGRVLMATGTTAATWQDPLAKNNVFTKSQVVTPVTLTSTAGSIAVDASLSNNFEITLTENTTLAAPTNLVAGMHLFFHITQSVSTSYTLAFASIYKFDGGTDGVMPTAAGAKAIMACYCPTGAIRLESVFNGANGFS